MMVKKCLPGAMPLVVHFAHDLDNRNSVAIAWVGVAEG